MASAARSGIGPPSEPAFANHVVEKALAYSIENETEPAYRFAR